VTDWGRTEAYTVAPGAPRAAVDAAHRGALLALVERLEMVSLEIPGRGPWPPEVAEAVTALLPRRRRLSPRRRASVCTDLVPADGRELALAVAVVPYADYVVGITHDGTVAYDTVDQGTAPRFELTAAELQAAQDYMTAQGVSPDLLVPDPRRDTHG